MSLNFIFKNLRQGLLSASHLGQVRLQLFSIELQEELGRQVNRLIWLLAAFVFASLGLIAASVLLWIIFWDTHRISVAIGLILLYSVLSTICLVALRYRTRHAPTPFSATIEEFRQDCVALGETRHE